MTELPVLSCHDCGKCCEGIGTPPFVYLHPSLYAGGMPEGYGEGDPETERWAAVPGEALKSLQDYYRQRDLDQVGDRYDDGLPCLWYDAESKSCRHYEWRPEVCRDFEVGGESCLKMRSREESP